MLLTRITVSGQPLLSCSVSFKAPELLLYCARRFGVICWVPVVMQLTLRLGVGTQQNFLSRNTEMLQTWPVLWGGRGSILETENPVENSWKRKTAINFHQNRSRNQNYRKWKSLHTPNENSQKSDICSKKPINRKSQRPPLLLFCVDLI